MSKLLQIILIFTVFIAGCAKLPRYSELSPAPDYSNPVQGYNTDAVCWIAESPDFNCQYIPPYYYSQDNTLPTYYGIELEVTGMIFNEMSKAGFTVYSKEFDYLTRKKRLSVDKVIVVKSVVINWIQVKEGFCYETSVLLGVSDANDFSNSAECVIFNRELLDKKQIGNINTLLANCLSNITNVPELRSKLNVN